MCIFFSLNYNLHRIFHSNKKSEVLHFQSLLERVYSILWECNSRICIFMSSWGWFLGALNLRASHPDSAVSSVAQRAGVGASPGHVLDTWWKCDGHVMETWWTCGVPGLTSDLLNQASSKRPQWLQCAAKFGNHWSTILLLKVWSRVLTGIAASWVLLQTCWIIWVYMQTFPKRCIGTSRLRKPRSTRVQAGPSGQSRKAETRGQSVLSSTPGVSRLGYRAEWKPL